MSDVVLVTGAFGLVGTATVRQLAADGRHVVATDLETPATRKAAGKLPPGVEVRWADLTDPAAVDALIGDLSPAAIIHLAAVIPPLCYVRPALARKVNVDAAAALVKAAAAQPTPPRFVQASSIAVYGPRNPHRSTDLLTAETPVRPFDLYGAHKVEVEEAVRSSSLDWVMLRLGGVLTVEQSQSMDLDSVYLGGLLPSDGRVQSVDVRDVARAFCAATTTDAVREVFMIAGDGSHQRLQGELSHAIAEAVGLVGGPPQGRPGNPDSDRDWFTTDWMDTARSQQVLSFQHHTFPDMIAETRTKTGWIRYPLRAMAPLAREFLRRRSPYHGAPGRYADPWGAIRAKWGEPEPDGTAA
jgi:nucleoside-diphosphate-sugar epimerase